MLIESKPDFSASFELLKSFVTICHKIFPESISYMYIHSLYATLVCAKTDACKIKCRNKTGTVIST